MKLIIIGIMLFGAFICYAVCAVSKSVEEQKLDDEEQIKYLKEYRNKRSMVKY